MTAVAVDCRHHWLCGPTRDGVTHATCKVCGEDREFRDDDAPRPLNPKQKHGPAITITHASTENHGPKLINSQRDTLAYLRRAGECATTDVAQHLGISGPAALCRLESLLKHELVQYRRSPSKSGVYLWSLSGSARDAAAPAAPPDASSDAAYVDGVAVDRGEGVMSIEVAG